MLSLWALEQVMTAASMLQPGLRDRFLRSVAGRLADVRDPDDHAVRTAIEFVLGCYGVSIPASGAGEFKRSGEGCEPGAE
jgi:hypothetical protein